MSCSEFIQFLRHKCSQCFGINSSPKNNELEEKLVQLPKMKINHQEQQIVGSRSTLKNIAQNKVDRIIENEGFSYKRQPKSPVIEEEFHSIQEINCYEIQKNPKSKKNVARLDSLKRSRTQTKSKQKTKSQIYTSGEWEDTPVNEKLNIWNQVQKIKDWFRKQYGRVKFVSFRVNHAVRLRMQGNGMMTLLTHKLQDFKIKFTEENQTFANSGLQNKSKTLTFQYLKEQFGQNSYKRNKILSYYEIKTYAPSLQQLMRAFISKEAMKILHGFKYIQPVEYEGKNLRIAFPILQVHQNISKSKNDRVFHLASQMGESHESSEEQRDILFVVYSLDESQQNWQCVIRIMFGFLSSVEIYSESCEDEKPNELSYFNEKFTALQKYLFQLKIIPAN